MLIGDAQQWENPMPSLNKHYGGVTRKGWKLFVEEGQETTESIDSEKDTIE